MSENSPGTQVCVFKLLVCLTNSQKLKDILFTMTEDKEKQQILRTGKQEAFGSND